MDWEEVKKTTELAEGTNRLRLTVRGRVQGVGFRPSIYRFARKAGVAGFVKNTPSGVIIEIEGDTASIDGFGSLLVEELPPLARIDSIETEIIDPAGDQGFSIETSEDTGSADALFPVDTAVCGDCLREMNDPADERYRYPFINCTNCGPRFTIIQGLPYDRPLTTMEEFAMDGLCSGQYADPSNRRFHAEPISCPNCGPALKLIDTNRKEIAGDPINVARQMIAGGGIIAVKGLGGYHFACMATDGKVVELLRRRKKRPAKPFALMFGDMDVLRDFCFVDETEVKLLQSPESPIVLLKRIRKKLPEVIAPGNGYIGAFLPYTPVHHMLIEGLDVLVMTSGNFTDEPLISTEEELGAILGTIADAALTNNRRIAHKCDDSIFFVPGGTVIPIRRARGFVPEPIMLPQFASRCVLGVGGQEKGTFTLTRGERAYVSPHLGDLGDLRSQINYRAELEAFKEILDVEPKVVVCDMHPDYFTTRLADEIECDTRISVQHHHAHSVSVMVEYGIEEPVIGVSFDGTGYGSDGNLWGGEFLFAEYHDFKRLAHLKYIPLPGGSVAVREPWRMTLMHLWNLFGDRVLEDGIEGVSLKGLPTHGVLNMAKQGINTFATSSMGRLFDAVACMLGCGTTASYEAQAAIALESLAQSAGRTDRCYSFDTSEDDMIVIEPAPVIENVLKDIAAGVKREEIAAVFHNSIAQMTIDIALELAKRCGTFRVVLSGGVFQNRLLCERIMELGASQPLNIYQHGTVPPNDGGISLGQVQAGIAKITKGLV